MKKFYFNAYLYRVGWVVIGAMGLIVAIALVAMIINFETLQWQVIPILLGSMGVFVALGLYAMLRHRGHIEVDEQAITLVRGRTRFKLNYEEITSIKEFNRHVPPGITLTTENSVLSFSRMIEDFDKLYKHLAEHIEVMQQPHVGPMQFSARSYFNMNSFGILGFFYILFGLITLMINLMHPEKNSWVESFTMMMLFATFFGGLGTLIGIPWGNKVVTLTVENETMVVSTFFKKKYHLKRSDIKRMQLKNNTVRVRGIERQEQSIAIETTEGVFTVTEKAAHAFKTGVPRLWQLLKNWYQTK